MSKFYSICPDQSMLASCSSTSTITLYILESFKGYRGLNISREHVKYLHNILYIQVPSRHFTGHGCTTSLHSTRVKITIFESKLSIKINTPCLYQIFKVNVHAYQNQFTKQLTTHSSLTGRISLHMRTSSSLPPAHVHTSRVDGVARRRSDVPRSTASTGLRAF
jgi:hypothetical protein